MTIYSFTLTEIHNNLRLDKVLSELLPDVSRSLIQKAIKAGHVKLQNVIISDSAHKVKSNDIIHINLTVIGDIPYSITPFDMKLDIIYEDKDLIVINKPPGLTVHPGIGAHNDTLVNALMHHTNSLSDLNGEFRPGIVHRLDRYTSGLMVIAKNNLAHANLAEQIATRNLVRKYKALVFGIISPSRGIIQTKIARNRLDPKKMSVIKSTAPNPYAKEAITYYSTELILVNGLVSLVECQLKTGRTHQIRVHLSHIGHSIIGDQTYGNNSRKIKSIPIIEIQEILSEFKHQALHSYHIAFNHPISKKILEFTIGLPKNMQTAIDTLLSAY